MNILCKLFGHKIKLTEWRPYDDTECARKGCNHIIKGIERPKIPPMPAIKQPDGTFYLDPK